MLKILNAKHQHFKGQTLAVGSKYWYIYTVFLVYIALNDEVILYVVIRT